jgi:hypothetical protein
MLAILGILRLRLCFLSLLNYIAGNDGKLFGRSCAMVFRGCAPFTEYESMQILLYLIKTH